MLEGSRRRSRGIFSVAAFLPNGKGFETKGPDYKATQMACRILGEIRIGQRPRDRAAHAWKKRPRRFGWFGGNICVRGSHGDRGVRHRRRRRRFLRGDVTKTRAVELHWETLRRPARRRSAERTPRCVRHATGANTQWMPRMGAEHGSVASEDLPAPKRPKKASDKDEEDSADIAGGGSSVEVFGFADPLDGGKNFGLMWVSFLETERFRGSVNRKILAKLRRMQVGSTNGCHGWTRRRTRSWHAEDESHENGTAPKQVAHAAYPHPHSKSQLAELQQR